MTLLFVLIAIAVAVLVEIVIRHRRSRLGTPADHIRAGDRSVERGRLEEAEEHYRESIRLDHANPEAHYKLAHIAWERGDFVSVIEHLQDCQRWVPDVADMEHGLGAAHYHLGDHEAALRHYLRARELDPEDDEVRGSLAALYHELGRVAEAQEVWPEYEPPSAEEVERAETMKQVWAEMSTATRRGLRRYQKTIATLGCISLLSFGVALVSIIAVAVTFLYGWITQTHVSETWLAASPGTLVPPLLKGGVAIGFLTAAAVNLMERQSGRFMRRAMVHSGVSQEEAETLVPPEAGPAWWQVELSGGHLVLWLALPVLVLLWRNQEALPDWTVAPAIYLGLLWFFKAIFIFHLLTRGDESWQKEYRAFGSLKGALIGLLGIPAAIALTGWLVWQLL